MANRFVDKLGSFVDLSKNDVAALQGATSAPRRYAPKQDLIREGDQPGPVFVVLEGWACRYKILPNGARQIMAFLMPGDCCDLHMGMLAEMDHGIQAITSASIATIPRADMEALMDGSPNITRAMYVAQLVDESTMRSWIVSMALSAATLRVLEAALPAKFHGADGILKSEADIAAKADPASAAHVRALLDDLSHRLSPKRAPTQGLSELEWAQIDPPTKASKP